VWCGSASWWWVRWAPCHCVQCNACAGDGLFVRYADSSPGTTSPTINPDRKHIRNRSHSLLHAYARQQRPGPVPSLSHPAAGRAVAGGCLVSEAQNRQSPLSRRPCFNRCFTVTEAHMRRPLRGAPCAALLRPEGSRPAPGRRLCLVDAPNLMLCRRSARARQLEQDPSASSLAENQLAGSVTPALSWVGW
jgi:hypothetical protein